MMENDSKERNDDVNEIEDELSKEPIDKSRGTLFDCDEDKEIEGEEAEQSTTTTHVRRKSFKKPRPFFYIGGSNGTHLVEEFLTALGWERITDKAREDFKLKWCEIKSHNNYQCFREGDQLCYQIPNNKLLTTKIGLLTSLQEYDRVMNKVKKGKSRIMKYQEFFPETYRLDIKDDRELFFDTYVENEVWISKPTGMNQGKGIYLIRSTEDITRLQEKIAEVIDDVQTSRKLPFKVPMARIVQRYVERPLLLEDKKFDVRNYLLIACTNPLVVFYADGYCRLTCMAYDRDSTDLTGHLTNQFMQKKNPLYEEVKEDTVWSMDRFNDYVNDNFAQAKDLPEDWVHTVLRKRCQQVMLHCFQAVRHKLECRLGFFDLIGCDFLVDEEFKISLLEMNCNPALHTNCDTLKEIIPDIVSETLRLVLEIFEKATKRERIMPLSGQRNFILLYNGDSIEAAERRERLQSAAEARKRARSAQRRKRFIPGQYVYKRTVSNSTTSTPTTTTTTASIGGQTSTASSQSTQSPSSVSSVVATTSFLTTSSAIFTTAQSCRNFNLPSSTVTALTVSSQHRASKAKNASNSSLKPFYAGGSITTTRPFSAPRVNRKYAQVESKVMSHNNLYSMESPRRDNINNAALDAASNSKIVNYVQKAKSVLLTPKREDITDLRDSFMDEPVAMYDDSAVVVGESADLMDRENLFERILEEADEMEVDEENEDEEFGEVGTSPSPEAMRRPSAKLPPHYHNSLLQNNLITGAGASSWPRYSYPSQSVQKKISRIASLSVKGNMELPLPSVTSSQHMSRAAFDQLNRLQYKAPTSVRIKQSLPGTTCTLEIGPKARRGLIAVSTGKLISPGANEIYTMNRKLNNTARLKLMNTSNHTSDGNGEETSPSALVYLATNHLSNQVDQDAISNHTGGSVPITGSLVHGALPPQHNTFQQFSNQIPIRQVPVNNVKLKADSSTQTSRRSNALFTGEEKVIWRLRSRVSDGSTRSIADGSGNSLVPQLNVKNQKVPLRVPVVTQSPGLISPRKGSDLVPNRRMAPGLKKPQSNSVVPAPLATNPNYQSRNQRGFTDAKDSQNPVIERDVTMETGEPCAAVTFDKPTALSKVVAIATAVPTRSRPNETQVKMSSVYDEEGTLLTAG